MAVLIYLLGAFGGAASGLQTAVNGRLGALVGALNAAVISTTAALVSLLAYSLLTRQLDFGQWEKAPVVLLSGGILGAFFVNYHRVELRLRGPVARVLDDDALARRLSGEAASLVRQSYSDEAVTPLIRAFFASACRAPPGPGQRRS